MENVNYPISYPFVDMYQPMVYDSNSIYQMPLQMNMKFPMNAAPSSNMYNNMVFNPNTINTGYMEPFNIEPVSSPSAASFSSGSSVPLMSNGPEYIYPSEQHVIKTEYSHSFNDNSNNNSPTYSTFFHNQDPISPTTMESTFNTGIPQTIPEQAQNGSNEYLPMLYNPSPISAQFPRPPVSAPETFKLKKNCKLASKKRCASISKMNVPSLASNANSFNKKPSNRTTQPGPIPASQPKLSLDQETGRELVTFSYSKHKIITQWTVKCPKPDEKLNILPQLDDEFLKENCIYKRAFGENSESRGSRQDYEKSCNELGWQLCYLNPELRNSRGLLQRAVDSWRNTRPDEKVRSRRVRKQNKTSASAI